MFGKKKQIAAMRAEIDALKKALAEAGAEAPENAEAIPDADKYWTPDGRPLYTGPIGKRWLFPQSIINGVHCLIAGTTGCGKSTFINSIIYDLMLLPPARASLFLCDPKKVELSRYQYLPHCSAYADTHADILRVVQSVGGLMDQRFDAMKKSGVRKYEGGAVYLIIDEIADLRIGPYSKPFTSALQRILQLGRAANIHVIAATQAPNRQIIPASLVINFPQRVGLRCASGIESRQIVGVTGCESLPKYGECIFADGADISREAVPLTEDAELDERIAYWRDQDLAAYACITRAARKNPINQWDRIARVKHFLNQ